MLYTFGQDNPISFREEVANVQWTKKIAIGHLSDSCDLDILNVELLIYFQMMTAKRGHDYTNNIFPSSSSMTRTWILFPHYLFCYCLTEKLRQKMTSNTLHMKLKKGTNVLKQIHNKCFINSLSYTIKIYHNTNYNI